MNVWVVLDQDEDEGDSIGAVFATMEAAIAAVEADYADEPEVAVVWAVTDDEAGYADATFWWDGKETPNGVQIWKREVLS